VSTHAANEETEVEQLRRRIVELEAQLIEVEAWANETVGAAQERLYWLDRWHLDLNEVMRHPTATRLRALARGLRWPIRRIRRLKKQARSWRRSRL
jgi:hypothetical protein